MNKHLFSLTWKAAIAALFACALFLPVPCHAGFVSTLQLVPEQSKHHTARQAQEANKTVSQQKAPRISKKADDIKPEITVRDKQPMTHIAPVNGGFLSQK